MINLLKEASANQAANELEVALKNEIDKGLVSVERKDGKVFVTVGSGEELFHLDQQN